MAHLTVKNTFIEVRDDDSDDDRVKMVKSVSMPVHKLARTQTQFASKFEAELEPLAEEMSEGEERNGSISENEGPPKKDTRRYADDGRHQRNMAHYKRLQQAKDRSEGRGNSSQTGGTGDPVDRRVVRLGSADDNEDSTPTSTGDFFKHDSSRWRGGSGAYSSRGDFSTGGFYPQALPGGGISPSSVTPASATTNHHHQHGGYHQHHPGQYYPYHYDPYYAHHHYHHPQMAAAAYHGYYPQPFHHSGVRAGDNHMGRDGNHSPITPHPRGIHKGGKGAGKRRSEHKENAPQFGKSVPATHVVGATMKYKYTDESWKSLPAAWHEEAYRMGSLNEAETKFTKNHMYSDVLSTISENTIRHKGVHRYCVRFWEDQEVYAEGQETAEVVDGEYKLSPADGLGFVFSDRLPCAKNMQRLQSIFLNKKGVVCLRRRADVTRCHQFKTRPFIPGDYVYIEIDLENANCAFWVEGVETEGKTEGPPQGSRFFYGDCFPNWSIGKLDRGFLTCVLKFRGVATELRSYQELQM